MKRKKMQYFADGQYTEKPYDRCLECEHLGQDCDGPNCLAMSLDRWCEWSRSRKDDLGWTNAYVSEVSGVSLATINRIMSGACNKDIKLSTAADVTQVLVNGSWGQYPCAMELYMTPSDTEEALKTEIQQLKSELAAVREERQQAVRHVEEVQQGKVDYLKALVNKAEKAQNRYRLATIIMSAILFMLVLIDAMLPNFGWFRY